MTVTGFKTMERKGVLVVAGDRVAVGNITLEVGRTDTVEVTAQAPLLQTQTGDRASTVADEAVRQVPTFSQGTAFYQAAAIGARRQCGVPGKQRYHELPEPLRYRH